MKSKLEIYYEYQIEIIFNTKYITHPYGVRKVETIIRTSSVIPSISTIKMWAIFYADKTSKWYTNLTFKLINVIEHIILDTDYSSIRNKYEIPYSELSHLKEILDL